MTSLLMLSRQPSAHLRRREWDRDVHVKHDTVMTHAYVGGYYETACGQQHLPSRFNQSNELLNSVWSQMPDVANAA